MKSAVKAVVREPLFHFLLLAAALFVVGSLFTRSDDVIEVSREEIEWRILQVEAGRGTRLTDDERRLVEQQYIDERVLVREAQAMGLSADERIDDILVQKMLHVLSGDVIQPSAEELEAYYTAKLEWYVRSPAVTVDELVVAEGAPLPPTLREGVEPEQRQEDRHVLEHVELHAVGGEHSAVLSEVAVELLATLAILGIEGELEARDADLRGVVDGHVAYGDGDGAGVGTDVEWVCHGRSLLRDVMVGLATRA